MYGSNLRSGRSRSCGCLARELIVRRNTKHGHATRALHCTVEYNTWSRIISRCENAKSPDYPDYGGRGISICLRWRNSFAEFLKDMDYRPSDAHEIDRIDNDGNYEPANCRWATRLDQANNTRVNRFVEYQGRRMTVAQWARDLGLNYETLRTRLKVGWSLDRALRPKAA